MIGLPSEAPALDRVADVLEQVLASHRVGARVWGGEVTPILVRFQLTTIAGIRLAAVQRLQNELAMALGVDAVVIRREGQAVVVEVPRAEPAPILSSRLLSRMAPQPPLSALLGIESNGTPLVLRLSSDRVVHLLISGTTGAGKTTAMRTMLYSMVQWHSSQQVRMVLVGSRFRALAGLPHVLGVCIEPGEALAALRWSVGKLDRRIQADTNRPWIVIVVDEVADLLAQSREIEGLLVRLAQRGREHGFRIVAGTQKPAAEVISTLFRSNMPSRLVLRVASKEDARLAAGVSDTGAESLLGSGDGILVADGRTLRVHIAWPDKEPAGGSADRLVGERLARPAPWLAVPGPAVASNHAGGWPAVVTASTTPAAPIFIPAEPESGPAGDQPGGVVGVDLPPLHRSQPPTPEHAAAMRAMRDAGASGRAILRRFYPGKSGNGSRDPVTLEYVRQALDGEI